MAETEEAAFREIAPPFMHLLLEDFPVLGPLDAGAVFGNGGYESMGFTKLQEISPAKPGSRGGYGWFMWTGSRRVAYEDYCARNGKDPAAPASNYAFLFIELRGPESAALTALVNAKTLDDKTVAFEKAFERAGIKAYARRKQWALIALEAYEGWLEGQGAGDDPAPDSPETLPAPSLPEMATVEAVLRLSEMTPARLAAAAKAIALARAVQDGWLVSDPKTPARTRDPSFTPLQLEKETMNGIKSWFQSKTVLASLGSLAALLGPLFGLDLGQTNINDAVVAVNELVAAAGVLIAIYGRVTAKREISGGLTGKG